MGVDAPQMEAKIKNLNSPTTVSKTVSSGSGRPGVTVICRKRFSRGPCKRQTASHRPIVAALAGLKVGCAKTPAGLEYSLDLDLG